MLDEIDGGLAPSSVHRHYRTLRRMFQVAVEKQKILANPCERVHPPKVPKTEMTFLTWEQSITLAEAHADRFQAMIYLAVDSGMRWGELIGLQRKNRVRPSPLVVVRGHRRFGEVHVLADAQH